MFASVHPNTDWQSAVVDAWISFGLGLEGVAPEQACDEAHGDDWFGDLG